MADRSDETTVSEPGSTDDLLEETDRLLSETGFDEGGEPTAEPSEPDSSVTSPAFEPDRGSVDPTQDAADSASRSRLNPRRWLPSLRVPSTLSPSAYFSPRAYLALAGVFGAGYFVGNATIPIAGPLVGLAVAAFLVGTLTAERRYLEVTTAGASIGAIMAIFDFAVAFVAGVGTRLVIAGLTAGLLAALLGYYFGRDLRDGLTRSE
ncbi:DUF456 domain-containing protein [Halovivax limisalsi]|uniref:DUF456 domain-containing protein n=1 Tax=Halovivax limisalsi TaxID=1453760 RepID=UPI001FFD85E6|nr:DUF456 domain-containing protein [Halovivax limisalsi]